MFWAEFFGVLEGDEINLKLSFPADLDKTTNVVTLKRDRATQFLFAGRRSSDPGWPTGHYSRVAQLLRPSGSEMIVVDTITATIELP